MRNSAGERPARRAAIGRVTLHTQEPVMFDSYRRNRDTGSFILIDEATGVTVGAGMINSAS